LRSESKAQFALRPERADARCNRGRTAAQAAIGDPGSSILDPRSSILIKRLGRVEYEPTWHAMKDFTARRTVNTPDELWLLEHPPVYTLGVAARPQHLPRLDNGVPIVKTDRGGQITYHGPGQTVVYLLLDMRRRGLSVRPLVRLMENAVIDLLQDYGVAARGRVDAPGVYVDNAKIAALGLRIRNGCCYHGIALNVDMDLSFFRAIDPCGYPGLEVTQVRELGFAITPDSAGDKLVQRLLTRLQTL
jgi:lipoyl(octanoyl) transferase